MSAGVVKPGLAKVIDAFQNETGLLKPCRQGIGGELLSSL